MSKNKKIDRETKRWIGLCLSRNGCYKDEMCPYIDQCKHYLSKQYFRGFFPPSMLGHIKLKEMIRYERNNNCK